jgi:hypothetical protein
MEILNSFLVRRYSVTDLYNWSEGKRRRKQRIQYEENIQFQVPDTRLKPKNWYTSLILYSPVE